MIKDLILSESYSDNELAVNILKAKDYPIYQIEFIIREILRSKYNPYFYKSSFVHEIVESKNRLYFLKCHRYFEIDNNLII